jgi:hypothetical protein
MITLLQKLLMVAIVGVPVCACPIARGQVVDPNPSYLVYPYPAHDFARDQVYNPATDPNMQRILNPVTTVCQPMTYGTVCTSR